MIRTLGGELITLEAAFRSFDVGPIVEIFGQWAVTEEGIDCLVTLYQIDAAKLTEKDWVAHLGGKPWINIDEFKAAYAFAIRYHKVNRRLR